MELTPGDADTIILKAPSDIGIRHTARKGTLAGPDAVLDGQDLPHSHIDQIFPHEFSLSESQQAIATRIDDLLPYGTPLLTVGGDHSISYPVINRFKQVLPDLGVLWIDAHFDLKEIRLDSGIPHDAVVRGLLQDRFQLADVTFLGVREEDPDETRFLDEHSAQTISVDEPVSGAAVTDQIDTERPYYISFDIDVLDSQYAPGTTFPSSDGLTPDQAIDLLRQFDQLDIVGADLVEVAPPLDRDQITVQHARTILDQLLRLL
jgi:arginase family enzyme